MVTAVGDSHKTGQELRLTSNALDRLFNTPPPSPTTGQKILFTTQAGNMGLAVVCNHSSVKIVAGNRNV